MFLKACSDMEDGVRACVSRVFVVIIALCIPLISDAAAQGLTSGALEGVVVSTDGEPLSDVLVTLSEIATGVKRTVVTDVNGRFEFTPISPGEYEVLAERVGYRPIWTANVPARPARRVRITVALPEAAGPVTADTMRFDASAAVGNRPGVSEWFSRAELAELPHATRQLSEVLRLSTARGWQSTEGLPERFTGFVIDGVPQHLLPQFDADAGQLAMLGSPLGRFEAAELVTNGTDIERSGFAGGSLNGYTRRGTGQLQARGFGSWAGDATTSSAQFTPTKPAFTNVQAAALLSGPLVRDSAHFLIGIEARRNETPFPALWNNDEDAEAAVEVAKDHDIALTQHLLPRTVRSDALSAFGRADWQISESHGLAAGLTYAAAPQIEPFFNNLRSQPFGAELEARSFDASATLLSRLSEAVANEARIGFVSRAADSEVGGGVEAVPLTVIVPNSFVFGNDTALPLESSRTDLFASNALHVSAGSHQLKAGAALEFGSMKYSDAPPYFERVRFGSVSQFADLEGVSIQTIGAARIAEFDVSQYSGFLQDTWRPHRGLELTTGVRYERELLPAGDVVRNREWERLTGLDNSALTSGYGKVSPRFSVVWDLEERHRWIFRAAAGVYHARAAPELLAEAIANDGRTRIQRRLGSLAGWPDVQPTDTAGTLPTLTLLAPEYRAARSTRGSIGLTRLLGSGSALHLAGSYRETDRLPRRVDLNRTVVAIAEDQHGRPLYGELRQQGGLIAAAPGSNRRFANFDAVMGINLDGRSEYRAISASIEQQFSRVVGVVASYTLSRTTDNWLGASDLDLESSFEPALDPVVADWSEARSDFDVPQRFVFAAHLQGPAHTHLAALYRYRSGQPFTPSFRAGVDANGDGWASNDPAFVDDQAPGMDELLRQWDCLRQQVGRFVERNSCRMEGVHTLDLRLTVRAFGIGNGAAELVIDGLNLVQSTQDLPDNALYLIDPAQQLTVDSGSGVVTVPLIANPRFGEPLVRITPARMLRIGIQLNW